MNCRDFERVWNERLDARTSGPPDAGRWSDLEEHAAACPACRALAAGYQALSLAVAALGQAAPPPVPPGFADRVLAAASAPLVVPGHPGHVRNPLRWAVSLAAAAALVMAAGLSLRVWGPGNDLARDHAPALGREPIVLADAGARRRELDPRDLTAALADATSETLSLAREASAPAARVGSQVLDDAELPQPPPSLGALPVRVVPSSEAWHEVGDRVNAGVLPLSGSARSAFSFLLGTRPGAGAGRPSPTRPPQGT